MFRWGHQSKYVKHARAGPVGRVGRAGLVEPVRRAGTVGRAGSEACDLTTSSSHKLPNL